MKKLLKHRIRPYELRATIHNHTPTKCTRRAPQPHHPKHQPQDIERADLCERDCMVDAKSSDGNKEWHDDAPASDAASGPHRRSQEHLERGRDM